MKIRYFKSVFAGGVFVFIGRKRGYSVRRLGLGCCSWTLGEMKHVATSVTRAEARRSVMPQFRKLVP